MLEDTLLYASSSDMLATASAPQRSVASAHLDEVQFCAQK